MADHQLGDFPGQFAHLSQNLIELSTILNPLFV